MQSIKRIEFKANCYLQGSWGSRKLGQRNCSMELFEGSNGHSMIEFIAGDDVEHIGIFSDENKRVVDFDGVFNIPNEAVELLKSVGYNVEELQ